jgi:deferrochelatase/peroxidase EfeB
VVLDRRQFLTRSSAAAIAAAGLGEAHLSEVEAAERKARAQPGAQDPLQADGAFQYAVASDPAGRLPAIPFHGPWQAGIANPPPPAACFVSFNVTATSRADLIDLLQTLTARARFLTQGGLPANPGPIQPPSDSGTLGPEVPADGLTVTVGFGSTLFDARFGIADRKPKYLVEMTSFPNDNLDPNLCGGDLLLQICAGSADTAFHALRDIAKQTRGGMQILWRMDGFVSPPRPTGVPRNHFGFMDGIANPNVTDPEVANRLLWVAPGIGEPDWAVGGSYHACRIIRMFIEFWDRVSLNEQQTMIGRHRASGNVLGTNSLTALPDFAADPKGKTIPLTAHIRLANPRTQGSENSRIFRRGYNYDNGVDVTGNLNVGLIFNAFQQDLKRQFIANQTRLIGEPMVDYISPVGGGYFFAVPGVSDSSDWYARRLFE